MKTSTLQIRTPEGIVFSQLLAGPVTRCLAWLVDFFVIAVLVVGMSVVLSMAAVVTGGLASAVMLIGLFVISIVSVNGSTSGQGFP